MHEFLTKGDDRVDHTSIGRESIAMDWAIGNQFEDQGHFDVVRRQLTRKLPMLTADVYSELVLSMQQQWPAKADEWTTVNTYPTCMKIVSRAANRVFSGKEMCKSDIVRVNNPFAHKSQVVTPYISSHLASTLRKCSRAALC